jgi:hypothetical protein
VTNLNQYAFCAKSQIHGFRATMAGRRFAEDQLIAALKAENANHPLASKEAVEALVEEWSSNHCIINELFGFQRPIMPTRGLPRQG